MSSNVLMVDNEKRMCGVLKAASELDNHHVEVTYNGDSAMEKFQKSDFDIVITDLKMLPKNGIEVREAIKKRSP